jgi:hypothetical protein
MTSRAAKPSDAIDKEQDDMTTTPVMAGTTPAVGTTPATPNPERATAPTLPAFAREPGGVHTATVLAKSLQRIGAPADNTPPRAPDAPTAGRYQRVIVIDEFKGGGISINPSDKVPDLSHGEVVRGILNAGINGDGRSDFYRSQVKDTSVLDKPFVGRDIGALKVGLDELRALDDKIGTDFAAQIARDPTLAKSTYEDQQRVLQVATQIRDKAAAGLKGKLISVDDAIGFNLGPANETVPTVSLGTLF